MKNHLIIMFLLLAVSVKAQQSFRMVLEGSWNDSSISSQVNNFSKDKQIWNDLMGWTHPISGKEFVIMGSIDSTYFFDVSNPSSIQKCAVYTGKTRSINRDYEVYKNYVYCVSDNGPPGVFQIFDLQYLPDSVHLVLEDTSIITRVHSLFVDSTSKRLYFQAASKTFSQKPDSVIRYDLLILSLDTPENPRVIGELKEPVCGRVHEAYYRNDTAYCSCEYRGLHAFDMRKADSIVYLGGISPPYPFNGYNHTSWLDDSGKFVVFTDEVPVSLPMKLYSIKSNNNQLDFDFENVFNSNIGATPHNLIWKGSQLWTSAYEDGLVLWNMNNPYAPKMEGFYDTYPQNKQGIYNGYTGCWGMYPFFESGNIAASDMRNGLFMIRYDQTLNLHDQSIEKLTYKIYPNPFSDVLQLSIFSYSTNIAWVKIVNLTGQVLLEKKIDLQQGENALKLEEVSELSNGVYLLSILSNNTVLQQPIIKY